MVVQSHQIIENRVYESIGQRMYLDEETADVHFVLIADNGHVERVPAHKSHLASGSNVFKTMFYGPMRQQDDITIEDATAGALREFLRFFYFSQIRLTMRNVSDLLYLGNKYGVTECFNKCIKFLERSVSIANVCQIYTLAIFYGLERMQNTCKVIIGGNTEVALASEGFLECNHQALGNMLKTNVFRARETVIFEACMNWVKNVSRRQHLTRAVIDEHLGELFYDIPFALMTSNEFIEISQTYKDIFLSDEIKEILQVIRKERCQSNFVRNFEIQWNDRAKIICDRSLYDNWLEPYQIQNIEITTFRVNRALSLGSFVCSNLHNDKFRHGSLAVDVIITVQSSGNINEPQEQVLYTGKANISAENTEVKLPKPIAIYPDFDYEIHLKLQDAENCTSVATLASVVNTDIDVTVEFRNYRHIHGQNRGLIQELTFNRFGSIGSEDIVEEMFRMFRM